MGGQVLAAVPIITLAEAAITAGFADQIHMNRHLLKTMGMAPGQWRDMLLQRLS